MSRLALASSDRWRRHWFSYAGLGRLFIDSSVPHLPLLQSPLQLSTVFAFGGYGRVGAAGPYLQLLFVVVGMLVGI